MVLLINGYYVIDQTATLKEKLTLLDPDLAELLSETVFWDYHRVGDIHGNIGDDIAEVKLLFLANLMSDYLSKDLYQELLGTSCISLEVFDKWWTVKRYLIDESFADVEQRLDSSVVSFFVKTGIGRVDLWIDKMQNKN
jgi:hypothetical protein